MAEDQALVQAASERKAGIAGTVGRNPGWRLAGDGGPAAAPPPLVPDEQQLAEMSPLAHAMLAANARMHEVAPTLWKYVADK